MSTEDKRKQYVKEYINSLVAIEEAMEPYKEQIRWMKSEIEMLKSQVEQQKQTYNYAFTECETEAEKDRLVKKFMKQLFNINF